MNYIISVCYLIGHHSFMAMLPSLPSNTVAVYYLHIISYNLLLQTKRLGYTYSVKRGISLLQIDVMSQNEV